MKVERKSKFYIFLIEILWGILFFALSSIVCVNFFVKSNQYSQETIQKNKAMLIGESVAESMKKYDGNLEGYNKIAENQYMTNIDDYVVQVTSENLELDYMMHHIQISYYENVLIEFDVMSGGN
ncbi:hypothetical protein [Anaerorhabdus furcosa]|uniref:Type II secretory pathway, pseudopilin PulG n=1 Tax=Anaerorhabdus furcosa TaxID=118967 RepID=A0A1T4JYD7_9FIRM|nr:hypothetical protein [Anaerorhabdus furcosa]SJZ35272.1 hypothetical protein SAMN02745191_0177 [Anaerorhabdus furcosa]